MISFTRAPRVEPGQAIQAEQFSALAQSYNDRFIWGIGNCDRRVIYGFLGALRSLWNPDESGFLTVPVAHYFEGGYQFLEASDAAYPATGPGEPEGANLNNLAATYVFGAESAGVYDEATRLSDPGFGGVEMWYGGRPPETPWEFWSVKKLQMGAWDPETGAVASPVFAAANSHGNIRASKLSPHGNSYGGYFAQPELGAVCQDPNPITVDGVVVSTPPPNYQIFFSPIKEGLSPVTFDGTCAPGPAVDPPDLYDLHVQDIMEDWQWFVYRVKLNNGTEVRLSMEDYVEGPYTGAPRLGRQFGGQLDRVLNGFISEFRGLAQNEAEAAGSKPTTWNREAADTQRFLSSQYLLAPQVGVEFDGGVDPYYPRWATTSPMAAGLVGHEFGGPSYIIGPGCICTGLAARAKHLSEAVTLEIEADGGFVGSVLLAEQASEAMLTLETPIYDGQAVTIRAADDVDFDLAGGLLEVEIVEQMLYKPGLRDLFLVLRLSGAAE